MRKIVHFFIRYPIWANAIIALTLVVGITSYLSLNKSFFPETVPRIITVQVVMPGASPEEMEEGVTLKIEEAVRGIPGINEINSTSSENFSNTVIRIDNSATIDVVGTDVKNAVDQISGFPESAEKPVVYNQKPMGMVAFMILSGNMDLFQLKDEAQDIEEEFLASDVVTQVNLAGFPSPEIAVEIPSATLDRYGLTIQEIAMAIQMNNQDISAGVIKGVNEQLMIRSRSKSVRVKDIENIVVTSNLDGSQVQLKELGTVTYQFSDDPKTVHLNGKRALRINILKLPSEDIEEISAYINSYVDDYNLAHSDSELDITFEFNTLLQARINMLTKNGVMGLMLVLLTLGMFLSLRLSAWVAYGIPASFLGMFIVGAMTGITINMISLFGMILVIGILVDDGIVIAENIYHHFEQGKSAVQAALDGTMEVMSAVFTSVLTTIVAFSVLLSLEGFDFIREMAIVVIAGLAFSLIEAFFILPAHLSHKSILKDSSKSGLSFHIRKPINRAIAFLRDKVYGGLLHWIVDYRYVFFVMPFVFLAIILGMQNGGILTSTFFPTLHTDDFNVEITFEPGERESKVEHYLERLEQDVLAVKQSLIEETGDTLITYIVRMVGNAENLGESGSHTGMLSVGLDIEGKTIDDFEIINRVRDQIGSIPEAKKLTVGSAQRFGKPVDAELSSRDSKQLAAATNYLVQELRSIPELKDVVENSSSGMRELQLELKQKAYFLGLNHATISQQIRQAFFGQEAQRLQIGRDEVKIWVRFPEADRSTIGQLEQMKIKVGGAEFPLHELVDYKMDRGIVAINRFNGKRQIKVGAALANAYDPVPPILARIDSTIVPQLQAQFPDVAVDFGGQRRRSSQAMGSMIQNGIIALFVIVLLITLNFRSLYQAVLIIALIPFGYYCAVFGHGIESWMSGKPYPFSILSMYGVLALAGVLINDAVVFLDKYNTNIKQHMKVKPAIIDAGINRFRPILLTSITTVVGLYPLIKESDFQAQFIIPMAISIAYGVALGTLFILLFFPVFILVGNDIKRGFTYLVHFIKRLFYGLWEWDWDWKTEFPVTAESVEPAMVEQRKLKEKDDALHQEIVQR